MEYQLNGGFAFGWNSKCYAIVSTQAKTWSIPFDLVCEVWVRPENGFSQDNDSIFQRMIQVLQERIDGDDCFDHGEALADIREVWKVNQS